MRFGVWAKAAVIAPHSQVLLVKRSKTDEQRPGDWDFPGGNIEPGEDITAGLLREINEETGLCLKLSDVQLAYAASETYDDISVTRLFYVARTKETVIRLSNEHEDYRWVSVDEALELFPHHVYGAGLANARDLGLLPHAS